MRRALARSLFVCCAMLGAGCTWLQNEFFYIDRAAPKAEQPAAEPPSGTEPRW